MTRSVSDTFRPIGTAPRSVYIHVPFCRHRCGYCNFALVADRDYMIDSYLDALAVEMSLLENRFELDTLFLGGGTPTHLSELQLEKMFGFISKHFQFSSETEVTTEANPRDLTPQKIRTLVDLGVNRFSLGVQSFDDSKLKLLERDHNRCVIEQVASDLKSLVSNFSFDLIFATMGESVEAWLGELENAITLGPTHLSTYELTIEKGTQFWNRHSIGELKDVDEDQRVEMYCKTIELLAQNGFDQYEISSFAKSESYRCRHNLAYWNAEPYFAFGPGAARYVDGIRETNHSSVSTYIKRLSEGKSPVAGREQLDDESRIRELIAIALRQTEGFDLSKIVAASGVEMPVELRQALAKLEQQGLIRTSGTNVNLTENGRLVYDSVASEIV